MYKTKSDQIINQNGANLKKILRGACPQTPLAKRKSDNKFLPLPPHPLKACCMYDVYSYSSQPYTHNAICKHSHKKKITTHSLECKILF